MPQLVAFARRWTIGSDDFVYPGIAEISLRIIWVGVVSIVFHLHKDAFVCPGGHMLRAYYIGLLSFLVVNIIVTAVVVYTSTLGTITNNVPRRRMAKLIYLKFAISFPEIVWNFMGTYWAFGKSNGCESHIVMTVKGMVISGWVVVSIVIVGICIVFDPLGTLHGDSDHETDQAMESAKKIWRARCQILCCCVGCDEQHDAAFNGISELFSAFFKGVDLVPTDIACGLILVHREQQKKKYELSSVCVQSTSHSDTAEQQYYQRSAESIPPTPSSLSSRGLPTPKSWMTIPTMCHYMKYALGSYGWPLYIFTHLVTGTCQLWSQCNYACLPGSLCYRDQSCWSSCLDCLHICKSQGMTVLETEKEFNELCLSLECCSCMMTKSYVTNDNCCRCNMAAIRKTTGVHPDDVVYASFHNKIYETPFFVCIDRQYQTVVVAVRGTLSLKDVITDLTAECDTLQIDGLDNCRAHRGILQAAKYVYNTLQRLCILEQAFDRAQGAKLVVTGHSLGAGTAALLAILLKPKYPDLICLAYSPPGELMSPCASTYSQEFTCSVVLGKDLVPRLGMCTMEDLKAKLLKAINECQKPKYQLLASGVWQLVCGLKKHTEADDTDDITVRRPLLDDGHTNNTYDRDNPHIENALHDAVRQSEQCRITHTPLQPPGQILHIREAKSRTSCMGMPEYYTEWAGARDFSEVIVSPKMLSDHLPDAVMRALDQLHDNNVTPTSHAHGAVIDV